MAREGTQQLHVQAAALGQDGGERRVGRHRLALHDGDVGDRAAHRGLDHGLAPRLHAGEAFLQLRKLAGELVHLPAGAQLDRRAPPSSRSRGPASTCARVRLSACSLISWSVTSSCFCFATSSETNFSPASCWKRAACSRALFTRDSCSLISRSAWASSPSRSFTRLRICAACCSPSSACCDCSRSRRSLRLASSVADVSAVERS